MIFRDPDTGLWEGSYHMERSNFRKICFPIKIKLDAFFYFVPAVGITII